MRLTEIFRQAAESEIVTAAYAINQGRLPELKSRDGADSTLSRPRSPKPFRI